MKQKSFAVLTLSVIALVALMAIFATTASVPLAVGESESSPPASVPLAAEEPESSPPAQEQESLTMLEWILSNPKGQELLEVLSQEIIDKLAVEPMPPMLPVRERQPTVNIISQTDLSDVEFQTLLEEKGIVLGGLDFRTLTEQEAREIRLLFEREQDKPMGVDTSKAKSITEAEMTGKIDELSKGLHEKNLISIDNMDWDLPVENGFAVEKMEVLEAILNYFDGGIDYSTDLYGDGYTNKAEVLTWLQNYYAPEPGEYYDIWIGLRYVGYRYRLDWGPNHPWAPYFSCYLWASPSSSVPAFIGEDEDDVITTTGWLNVHLHDYTGAGDYDCGCFAADTAYCSYKALGYGSFPIGVHIDEDPDENHGYNIFLRYDGGGFPDWQDLQDWAVVEPQWGGIGENAANVNEPWQTTYIVFPLISGMYQGELALLCAELVVDYDNATVSYSDNLYILPNLGDCEELITDVEFDTYLW